MHDLPLKSGIIFCQSLYYFVEAKACIQSIVSQLPNVDPTEGLMGPNSAEVRPKSASDGSELPVVTTTFSTPDGKLRLQKSATRYLTG
jgi:hypothetical protein